MDLPDPLQKMVDSLTRLPSLGPRTAERLALFLVNDLSGVRQSLGKALVGLDKVKTCEECFNLTTDNICVVCKDQEREGRSLCVVEKVTDLLAIEKTGQYKGRYFVLGGVIDPLNGLGPEELRVPRLLEKIKKDKVREVLLAVNPTIEGEATVIYLKKEVEKVLEGKVKMSRLGRGIPTGGDLAFADMSTLLRSLENREEI